MRAKTAANYLRNIAENRGYEPFHIFSVSDFEQLPPLPDPGPEPAWHRKGLGDWLEQLGVDKAVWDDLSGLGHVTEDYLHSLLSVDAERHLPTAELVALIRSGEPFARPAEDEDDDLDF